MAKSPRKNFSARPSTMGGKNIAQGVAAFQRSRRFSIVDSEEEQEVDDEEEDDEEDGEEEDVEQDVEHEDVEMVEDDSSLTAVSEEDEETIQSHYMAAVTSGRKKLPARSSDWYREMDQSHRGAERAGRAGTTGRGEESDNGSRSGFNSNSSSDSEDTSVGINQIYSMVGQESDEEESSDEFSSSDDSDVDFVKLQAERKARSMKAVRAIKGVRGKRPAQGQASAQTDTQGKVQTKGQAQKKERRRSVVKPKFGRRKSEVALPDDINFTFEFEEGGVIESESEESEPETGRRANRGKTSHGVNRSIGLSGVTRKAQKTKKSSQYEENSGESENDSEESYRGGASRSSVAGDSRSSVAATSRTSGGGVATSRSSVAGTSRTSEANSSGSGASSALSEANASEFGSGFEFTEDIGEEIQFSFPETLLTFDDPLPVPKIKEEELNSDEDYEIDDNELLATLQADNDDFGVGFSHQASRHNSLGSIDEDEDPFLKEEEKFLVNEFENNGFDDDRSNLMDTFHSMTGGGAGEDAVMQYESSDEEEDEDEEDDDYDVIDFGEFAEGDEDDQDDPEDQEDHDQDDNHESKSPRLLVSRGRSGESGRRGKSSGKKNKRMLLPIGITNSDEEDDSYLWNYFFSSDGGSSNEGVDDGAEGYGEEGPSFDDSEEEVIVEELFKQMERDEKRRAAAAAAASASGVSASGTGAGAGSGSGAAGSSSSGASSGVSTSGVSGARSVEDYDSGDSTDEDLSLPPTSKIKTGSQKAKEVLSSRTADYRPPVLGTWVAVDSKPFGIIDGLSTRSLLQHSKNAIPRRPRMGTGGAGGAGGAGALASVGKSPRSATGGISAGAGVGGTSDSAMGLDELLNISELDDDDENDVKIWQDFNSQKKRQVPLGAFRNKSILHQNMLHIPTPTNNNFNHTSKSNNEYNQRRYSLTREGGGGADHGKSAGPGPGPRRNSLMSGRKNSAAGIKKTRRSSSSSASVSAAVSGGAATTPVVPSKQKRRRASIIEAVSEGFRPTRSGLFSENALADVEEVLGDDHELMALIKGL